MICQPRLLLLMALLIGAAMRLPGVFWGEIDRSEGVILEPDEFQHIALAADYVHHWGGATGQVLPYRFWNTRAYGFQIGGLIYVAEKLGFQVDYLTKHALLGRFLSVFYGLLLILCTYHLGKLIFNDPWIGAWAAAFLAIFDLAITYSHYAIPASAYQFWVHLSLLLLIRYYDHLSGRKMLRYPIGWEVLLGASLAMNFGLKFDFLPFLLLGATLLFSWRKGHLTFSSAWWRMGRIGLVALLCFPLIHGFSYSWNDFAYSFQVAQEFNQNAIQQDLHWLHNPILYLCGVIGGSSIWIVVLGFGGCWLLIRQGWALRQKHPGWLLFLFFVAMEFGVRWMLDTPFIRRANVFLPFLAITAVWMALSLWRQYPRLMSWAIGFIWLYTFGLAWFGQQGFWQDTRYQALEVFRELPADAAIYYSTYAKIPHMPPASANSPEEADVLVVHETYYGRYWKYFTTPFKVPVCCEEVYNCANEQLCTFYQDLLLDKTSFELLYTYPTDHPFPERVLFKRFFGTYETFLGDLKIYKRKE